MCRELRLLLANVDQTTTGSVAHCCSKLLRCKRSTRRLLRGKSLHRNTLSMQKISQMCSNSSLDSMPQMGQCSNRTSEGSVLHLHHAGLFVCCVMRCILQPDGGTRSRKPRHAAAGPECREQRNDIPHCLQQLVPTKGIPATSCLLVLQARCN